MRKEFKEPELKRIELRLEEKIATGSGNTITTDPVGIMTRESADLEECYGFYVNTEITPINTGNLLKDMLDRGLDYDRISGCVSIGSEAMVLDAMSGV